jgi:hypothetical protein
MAQFKADGHEPVPASGLFNGVGVSLSENNILETRLSFSRDTTEVRPFLGQLSTSLLVNGK